MDEPTTGLDPLVQREFLRLVAEAAGRGAAVLLSSHVLPEVERMASRIVIIRDGRLVTTSTVDDLLDRARHRLELRYAAPVPAGLLTACPASSSPKQTDAPVIAVEGAVGQALRAVLAGPDLLRVAGAGDELEDLFVSLYQQKEAVR